MANKYHRTWAEMDNLFSDPKFFRQALKSVGQAILLQPAAKPIVHIDKDGVETYNSQIETYTYHSLAEDIARLRTPNTVEREPTELEMILRCQMIKARTDTSAAVFIRDTLGAKPIDESKIDATVSNPYQELSDEELELIADSRRKKAFAEVRDAADTRPAELLAESVKGTEYATARVLAETAELKEQASSSLVESQDDNTSDSSNNKEEQ